MDVTSSKAWGGARYRHRLAALALGGQLKRYVVGKLQRRMVMGTNTVLVASCMETQRSSGRLSRMGALKERWWG